MSVSPAEDRVAHLLRTATAFKKSKKWEIALAALLEAKRLMLSSSEIYPAETWCKYPLYLQRAGRTDEALAEFQFLLDDLEQRARRDARLDDPSVGPAKQKQTFYRLIIREDRKIITRKMELARLRSVTPSKKDEHV